MTRNLTWRAAVLIGACAVAGYFLLPGPGPKDLGYSVIGFASAAAVMVGRRRRAAGDRDGWYPIAAGNLCFVLGDSVYDLYQFVLHRPAPFPSVADVFYLAGYPLLIVGVVRLTRVPGRPGASRETYADAAIVTVGALAVAWHFLLLQYATSSPVAQLGTLVSMAYPVMDLGVLFIVVRGMLAGAQSSPVLRLLVAAMVSMIAADFAYELLSLHGAYHVGNPVDAAWLVNYVLVGAAALHPSVAVDPGPVVDQGPRSSWRLPVVGLAGFVSPVILLVGDLGGSRADVAPLAATSIILFALVVMRMRWMFDRIGAQNHSLEALLAVRGSLEVELRHQAFHDSLTGLANRALLHDRIEHALAATGRSGGAVAVCFCDLDGFKTVNDSLGHYVGDALLVAVAERLATVVRPGDTVARLGGDEFAVLMEDLEDPAAAVAVAERIVAVLRQPVSVGDREIGISSSVGVTVADRSATTERLLREADSAMYEAKAAGKGRCVVFEDSMHARIGERLQLANGFAGALASDEFVLDYQPQFRLDTGALEGFEALLRWHHPTLGLIGPDRFLPVAEETGYIVPIDRWVLERACEQGRQWGRESPVPLTVSVNLSGRQLLHANLVDDVRTALALAGLQPSRLVLEVSESVLMLDAERSLRVLDQLKAIGVRLAIDAFGTGYPSLSYLRRMPVDELKIDRSFVEPLLRPATQGAAFLRTIIALADGLGLHTVAEGIEHPSQRKFLHDLGCDSAQGYLLGRPLDAEGATDLIGTRQLEPG